MLVLLRPSSLFLFTHYVFLWSISCSNVSFVKHASECVMCLSYVYFIQLSILVNNLSLLLAFLLSSIGS